jgi:transcriptional regulator with XRE-family HTH domain
MYFKQLDHFYSVKEKNKIELIKLVGEKLKAFRLERKFSQAMLAYDCNIPINQVGRIERGEINTTIGTLYKLAAALDIDIKDLFE